MRWSSSAGLPVRRQTGLSDLHPGEPERDILIEDQGLDKDEVARRRLSVDGDNACKQELCNSIAGALTFGKQNTNPPLPPCKRSGLITSSDTASSLKWSKRHRR
ncbi:hypothetical protein D9M71_585750 [compost metagenome]